MDNSIDYNDTSGYNPLFLAVYNGEAHQHNALLENYSATEKVQGKTLINVAVARGHEEIVRWLTESDENGNSHLHIAIKENQPSVFNLLVEKFNVNEKNCRNETPLHCAAANGRIEFAKILIENGANVNARDNEDKTPLYYALEVKKNVELAEMLFKNGAVLTETDFNRWKPLSTAAGDGNLEMVKLLMNNGWNAFDSFVLSPFKSALFDDNTEVVEYMMKNSSKSNKTITEDSLNLYSACVKQSSLNGLKFLVNTGVKTKDNLLAYSILQKRYRFFKYLLTCRSKIDSDAYFSQTQLHWAIRAGELEIVKTIVNQEANTVKVYSLACKLAVYIAVENDNEDILQVLLNAGYSTDRCFDDSSPLHLAATYEHTRLVEMLLRAGADVNSETKNGYTPLHFAATARQPTVVKFLLESGADPAKFCEEHGSPLFLAIYMFSSKRMDKRLLVTPITFTNLVKITKMLISQKEGNFIDLLLIASRINVDSDENRQNSALILNTKKESTCVCTYDNVDDEANGKNGQFLPELVRCILNHLTDDEIARCLKTILIRKIYNFDISPNLLNILMEYNDSKLCCSIKICSNLRAHQEKSQLLLIDYTRRVKNLVDLLFGVSNYYKDQENNTSVLKWIIARLVLLTDNRDSRMLEFCTENKFLDWHKDCEQQKVSMQETEVSDDFNVTFHDILTQPVDKVANYVRNENFCRIVDTSCAKFPAYSDFIKLRIEKGIRRKDLWEECTNLMHNLIKRTHKIRFSDADLDHIFQHLSVLDLRRLLEAFS